MRNILLLLLAFTGILIDIFNIITSENKWIWIIFLFCSSFLFLLEIIELLKLDQFTYCSTNKKRK